VAGFNMIRFLIIW